ncbi:hypothetical protein PTSG_03527 [Salpingoeca rosetta]|uniref:Ubiquitin-like domain-containing protein n=1 Tax=Salpingoeca rosetta (strain ATCC 50818 / BSB-021) TaxID=946362 RepID=F2U5V5_SALR5|nr:uncharacterized protein PTSG_03527 [Salpingoeca rosetta]EGD82896.1 hypothetical protein PTSG_03527 [Salpingoeca rosetta]|eukprot:XP_004995260.1 hypothetical protein PTSG_03527 [Salpingoeca rosetta]
MSEAKDETAASMTLRVVYAKETKRVTVSSDQTVKDLKELIAKETGCPVAQMKLMFKGLLAAPGKPELDAKKISETGLKEKAKVLVVGATQTQVAEVTQADQVSNTAAFKAQAAATTVKKKWSEERVHREIIQKGPPADAPFAYRPGQDPLPDGPLAGLIGDGGKKARLHIKTANNKLIIHYPNTSQEV